MRVKANGKEKILGVGRGSGIFGSKNFDIRVFLAYLGIFGKKWDFLIPFRRWHLSLVPFEIGRVTYPPRQSLSSTASGDTSDSESALALPTTSYYAHLCSSLYIVTTWV